MTNGVSRLVVVGGGILGTMHAVEAARRGWEIVQIERDVAPRSASVRNFGLVWVGGRAAGRELGLALEARDRWESIASSAPGTGFRAAGSLTVARDAKELAVVEAACEMPDASDRGFSMLDADEARRVNPALTGAMLGALHCERDAIIEPRLTLGALRAHLDRTGTYRFVPGRSVVDVRPHAVVDSFGTVYQGDLVVCCLGANSGGLLAEEYAAAPLRRVRLQMLETEPFASEVPTVLADSDSLRYYPAYASGPLDRLDPQDPIAARWRAQLLLVRRLGGHLTIGDTHQYDEPFDFDVADTPSRHLLEVASSLLGPLPAVEHRWAGVYSEVTDPNLLYFRAEVRPGVLLVTGPGGRGMTLSPAIAGETFE